MKKILRLLGWLFLLKIVAFVGLYFYATGSSLDSDQYFTIENWKAPLSASKDTLTITTYNIGYLSGMTNNLPIARSKDFFESNMQTALDVLSQVDSDIVGFQEIDFESERTFDVDQLAEISVSLGLAAGYKSVNWDKRYVPFPYWPPSQQFGKIISGQAVASKFEITDAETVTLEKRSDTHFLYNAFYIDRLAQITDVKVGEKVIKVINVHLEAFDQPTRERQSHVIKDIYERYADTMPVILMGDFNSQPSSENDNDAMHVIMGARYIKSAIDNEKYQTLKDQAYTFSTGQPYQMIDYILYNSNFITCLDARVVREAGQISDHFPLTGRFIITE